MATVDVAKGLVELCKVGNFKEAIDKYYGADIVSVEPEGGMPTVSGFEAVKQKTEWFESSMEVHGLEIFGPYVSGDQFVVRFVLDATDKKSGDRRVMDEVGIYTVKDDKVVHESFLYGV